VKGSEEGQKRAETHLGEQISKGQSQEKAILDRLEDSEEALRRGAEQRRAEGEKQEGARKEGQQKLHAAETQAEWLRSERDEQAAQRVRERKEAAQRLQEAEANVSIRLKAKHKEDLKRQEKDLKASAAKEAKALQERVRALEQQVAQQQQTLQTQTRRNDNNNTPPLPPPRTKNNSAPPPPGGEEAEAESPARKGEGGGHEAYVAAVEDKLQVTKSGSTHISGAPYLVFRVYSPGMGGL
jgi:hypothetical protein